MSDDILKLFWTNIDWHRKNKQMSWRHLVGGNTSLAINYKLNVSLKKVEEIAKKLGIDDYAILFDGLNE